jgi:small subunit ribosomal protein S26e
MVQCSLCGQLVPSDKAKKFTRRISVVDPILARELRQKGTYVSSRTQTKYYCVSCAVHRGVVKVRSKDTRRTSRPRRRR